MSIVARAKSSPARARPTSSFSGAPRSELQALAKGLKISATQSNEALKSAVAARLGEVPDPRKAVKAAFELIDKNGDGELSRIEVIKAVRTHASVRALLSLPEVIRQEDGTRDVLLQGRLNPRLHASLRMQRAHG